MVVHPDITVRGIETHERGGGAFPKIWDTDSGYQWSGLTAQVAIEKEFKIYNHWFFTVEGKATHANANIDLNPTGSVNVPNTALHLTAGIKYNFND